MTEIILLAITSVICIIGLAEIIHEVRLYIFAPQKRALSYMVVYLDKVLAEQQLRFAAEHMVWHGRRHVDNVIAVNSALSGETFENCRKIAAKYNIFYCSGEELANAIHTFEGRF